MGVLACDRLGCENIMCNRLSDRYGYICNECFDDLVNYCKRYDSLDCIDEFMQSPKRYSFFDYHEFYDILDREFRDMDK